MISALTGFELPGLKAKRGDQTCNCRRKGSRSELPSEACSEVSEQPAAAAAAFHNRPLDKLVMVEGTWDEPWGKMIRITK
mmetsp:Transcript_63089/g.133188  ORF Transcript_63089/g.133188 Transcript_63089/m.133188 type:complete len:80 (-) Transcript_63089:14-253(-)